MCRIILHTTEHAWTKRQIICCQHVVLVHMETLPFALNKTSDKTKHDNIDFEEKGLLLEV